MHEAKKIFNNNNIQSVYLNKHQQEPKKAAKQPKQAKWSRKKKLSQLQAIQQALFSLSRNQRQYLLIRIANRLKKIAFFSFYFFPHRWLYSFYETCKKNRIFYFTVHFARLVACTMYTEHRLSLSCASVVGVATKRESELHITEGKNFVLYVLCKESNRIYRTFDESGRINGQAVALENDSFKLFIVLLGLNFTAPTNCSVANETQNTLIHSISMICIKALWATTVMEPRLQFDT